MIDKPAALLIYTSAAGMAAANYDELLMNAASTWTVEQWAAIGVFGVAFLTLCVNTLFKILHYRRRK